MICDQCGNEDKCTPVTLKHTSHQEIVQLCGGCLINVLGTRELSGNLAKPVNQTVAMPVACSRSNVSG